MTGKILFYNSETQAGVISAEDGKRYDFIAADVMGGENSIIHGGEVDFELSEEGIPLGICVTTIRQPIHNSGASATSSVNTSSHNAETQVVEEEKPSLQLAPWFVTLLFGPGAFVLLSILYIPIGESMNTLMRFLSDTEQIREIMNFSNIYLFLLAIGATYVTSQKFDITLEYTTIKAAKMKDDSGKEQKIGFLSLEPEAAFLLMMPTFMVMFLCIGEGFRCEISSFIGYGYYFFKTILLAPIGLAVYMFAMNKPVVFIAMGDENNSNENKYTTFKSWTSAMLLTPGITMLIIFMINYFGLENIIYDNSEIMITVILLVMMLIIAAIINQIITLKRLQPIAKVKNDDK